MSRTDVIITLLSIAQALEEKDSEKDWVPEVEYGMRQWLIMVRPSHMTGPTRESQDFSDPTNNVQKIEDEVVLVSVLPCCRLLLCHDWNLDLIIKEDR